MGISPIALNPNLEDQIIFNQDLLPLAFDKPTSNYKAAAASFGPPRVFYFHGTHPIWWAFPIRPLVRRPKGD